MKLKIEFCQYRKLTECRETSLDRTHCNHQQLWIELNSLMCLKITGFFLLIMYSFDLIMMNLKKMYSVHYSVSHVDSLILSLQHIEVDVLLDIQTYIVECKCDRKDTFLTILSNISDGITIAYTNLNIEKCLTSNKILYRYAL